MTETGNQFYLLLAFYKTSVGSKLSNKELAIETHSNSYANSIKHLFSNDPIAYFDLLISGPIRTHNLSGNAILIRLLV